MNIAAGHSAVGSEAQEHLDRAYALYDLGEYDAALWECDTVTLQAPTLAEAHNLRGLILEELGREAEASAAYSKAVGLEHNFVEARQNLEELALALLKAGEASPESQSDTAGIGFVIRGAAHNRLDPVHRDQLGVVIYCGFSSRNNPVPVRSANLSR